MHELTGWVSKYCPGPVFRVIACLSRQVGAAWGGGGKHTGSRAAAHYPPSGTEEMAAAVLGCAARSAVAATSLWASLDHDLQTTVVIFNILPFLTALVTENFFSGQFIDLYGTNVRDLTWQFGTEDNDKKI